MVKCVGNYFLTSLHSLEQRKNSVTVEKVPGVDVSELILV